LPFAVRKRTAKFRLLLQASPKGYSPCGENFHALRLVCKHPDLRAGKPNLHIFAQQK
jgi:hypothetical protein